MWSIYQLSGLVVSCFVQVLITQSLHEWFFVIYLNFHFVYNCIFIIENACILIYPPRDVIRAVCGICIVTQIIKFFLCKLSCFWKWWNVCVMDYFLWIVISVNALSTCLSVNDVHSSSISLFRYIAYLSKSNTLYTHVVRYF